MTTLTQLPLPMTTFLSASRGQADNLVSVPWQSAALALAMKNPTPASDAQMTSPCRSRPRRCVVSTRLIAAPAEMGRMTLLAATCAASRCTYCRDIDRRINLRRRIPSQENQKLLHRRYRYQWLYDAALTLTGKADLAPHARSRQAHQHLQRGIAKPHFATDMPRQSRKLPSTTYEGEADDDQPNLREVRSRRQFRQICLRRHRIRDRDSVAFTAQSRMVRGGRRSRKHPRQQGRQLPGHAQTGLAVRAEGVVRHRYPPPPSYGGGI